MASVARYRNLVPSVVRGGRGEKNAGNEFNDAPIDAAIRNKNTRSATIEYSNEYLKIIRHE